MHSYDRVEMVARSVARYLAPMALLATIGAVYLIVHAELIAKHSPATPVQIVHTTNTTATRKHHTRRFYVVKRGDTLSTISAKTGVSIATIESLNPKVDPNLLQTGTRLRLR